MPFDRADTEQLRQDLRVPQRRDRAPERLKPAEGRAWLAARIRSRSLPVDPPRRR